MGAETTYTCPRAEVASNLQRTVPDGTECIINGKPVKSTPCPGGYQRFGKKYECYQKLHTKDFIYCAQVETMVGGDCVSS